MRRSKTRLGEGTYCLYKRFIRLSGVESKLGLIDDCLKSLDYVPDFGAEFRDVDIHVPVDPYSYVSTFNPYKITDNAFASAVNVVQNKLKFFIDDHQCLISEFIRKFIDEPQLNAGLEALTLYTEVTKTWMEETVSYHSSSSENSQSSSQR